MNIRTLQGFQFLLIALVASTIIGWIGYLYPGEHEPIVGALIWTGRLAFLIFLIPLFARPLRQLVRADWTAKLMRWRRNAGICYGASQSVHLVIVCTMFVSLANPPTETIMVIIGSMGLALSMAMLVTSFPAPTKFVGPKMWKWIHKSGFYVFMFIYFYDFVLEPVLLEQPTSHLLWASLTVAGMVVRTLAMFRQAPAAKATA